MRARRLILQPRRLLLAAALPLLLGAFQPAPAGAEAVGKKELRDARTAVDEGRFAEALIAYERILDSAATDKQRFEALYHAVLLGVSAGPNEIASGAIAERLAALGKLADSGENGSKLEIRALSALVGSLDSLRAEITELELERAAERAETERASEEIRLATDEARTALEARVAAEMRERLVVEQRLELAKRHLATREEELRARVEELSQCAAETSFILDQLEGTQASEVQMLQVVMRKNEDLAKARLALAKREKELADQTEQLELKEDEIRKREEAIREVTERVLGKEPPDS